MSKKKKKVATRIIAMLLMLGLFMTSTGFEGVTAMAEQNADTETQAEKVSGGEKENAASVNAVNTKDSMTAEEDINAETGSEDRSLMESEEVNEPASGVQSGNDAAAEENGIRSANASPVVMSSDYPQCLELWGILVGGAGDDSGLRARFKIVQSGNTFKFQVDHLSSLAIHKGVPGTYSIYVIPKEEFANGKIQDIYSLKKETLVTFDNVTPVVDLDFSGLTNYTFEVGDMLCFSPYLTGLPTFAFTGEQMVQDGYRTPPTHNGHGTRVPKYYYWDDDPEGSVIALYEFTGSGIKEILNNPPQFNSFSSLYLQQGGAGKNESDLIKVGVKATDDRDENGILPSTNKSIDFTKNVTYNFLSGGNGLGSSKFDAAAPSSWSVQYSVKDAWGSQKTSAARNVFVFPDLKAKKVTMDAFAYQDDGSIKINAASGEKIAESVGGYYVEFGDTTNNYVTKINTRAYDAKGGSLFDVIYGSDKKTFSVSSQGDAHLPDGGVISTDKIKQIKVAKDRSVTIDTSYTNHAGKEVSVKVTSTGEVIYPVELYIDSITFNDTKLGKIDIADTYDVNDLTKYLQAGQAGELKIVFWNPVEVNVSGISKTFKIEDFSIAGQWMDILSASGIGEGGTSGESYGVPSKGNGEQITQKIWNFKLLANSEKYVVTCKMALPEDFSIDIADYQDGSLPLVNLKARMTEADGSDIAGTTISATMAAASDPLSEGKTVLWSTKDDGTSLTADYARSNMASARTYDDSQWHTLADVSTNHLEITNEAYKLYDFTTSNWTNSSKSDFEGLTAARNGDPAIYSYGFTVKDTRRKTLGYDAAHPLESAGTSMVFAASKVAANNDKTKALMANGSVPVLTETKVSAYGTDADVVNEILRQVSFKAVQVSGDGKVTDLTVGTDVVTEIDGDQGFSRADPKPGEYTLHVYFSGQDKASGIEIVFKIEKNTWSYDTGDRTEQDGASGFIVIPKSILMERDPAYAAVITGDKPVVAGQGEVYFANYPNASAVTYDVSVDDTITLSKEGDASNSFVARSYVNGSTASDGKRHVGELTNKQGKGKGVDVCYYSTDQAAFTSKGKWAGTATFYFSRK